MMVFDENESFWHDFWTRHSDRMKELCEEGKTEEEAKAMADEEFDLLD